MDEADLELVRDWLTRAHQDLRAALQHAQAIYDFVVNLLPSEARL